jgi:hypothetical protein
MNILKAASLGVILLTTIATDLEAQLVAASPHTLIYKTRKDYSKYVPVELSADKKSVVSYPAPSDVAAMAKLTPVRLHKHYLMSRSGVSPNTAYLCMTIEAYSRLPQAPSSEELLKMIRDKAPVKDLFDCGKRNELSTKAINELIDKGQLKEKCKRIK